MKNRRWTLAGLLPVLLILATGSSWDKSIKVADGEVRTGDLSSINGSIRVGDNAEVGDCESVNGSIILGSNSRAEEIQSVNGKVDVGAGTVVEREISSVNGPVSLDRRARAGGVETVNGPIQLDGAEVGGDVVTINGDVRLLDGARVGGDVVIKDRGRGSDRRKRALRIELEAGSVIEGDVIVEDGATEVELHLYGGSEVLGRVGKARVVEH